MAKKSDRDRILILLSEAMNLSNLRIKAELDLSDDRYTVVRKQLMDEGLVEKYVCRGGGIRLTRKGERESPSNDGIISSVDNELALYNPLVEFLEAQAEEDGVETVVCDTHALKARGQWQNPDVTRISIEYYHHLRRARVNVTTYEVKQFPKWNVDVVYEAASHHRFSNESYVVLEWPNDMDFSLTDPTYKLDQIARECQRFGVGLTTMHRYYASYRLHVRLEPAPKTPDDEDVEAWLDYVFSRNKTARDDYDKRMQIVQKRLSEGIRSVPKEK